MGPYIPTAWTWKVKTKQLVALETVKICADLIQESQGAIAFSQVANVLDRPDAAAHRVDTLERNDLRDGFGILSEFLFEVFQVVVLKYDAFCGRMSHSLDHGSVIHLVGEDDAPREFSTKSGEGCIIGDVTRGEHQSAIFAVESGKLILQSEMHGGVPCNVARTTCTMTVGIQSSTTSSDRSANSGIRKPMIWHHLLHSFEYNRVISHAQIIVCAPNLDLVGELSGMSEGELLSHPVDVIEVAVRVVRTLLVKFLAVELFVIEEFLGRLSGGSLSFGVMEWTFRRLGRGGTSLCGLGNLGPLFLG